MTCLDGGFIPTNQIQTIPDATLYHFGVLTSNVHIAWMRAVCGRLKSDYRYFTDDTVMTIAVAEALMDSEGKSEDEIRQALVKEMQYLTVSQRRSGNRPSSEHRVIMGSAPPQSPPAPR